MIKHQNKNEAHKYLKIYINPFIICNSDIFQSLSDYDGIYIIQIK